MAIYDDEERMATLRQGAKRVIWVVAAVAILWLGAWFLFFRDTGSKTADLESERTSQDKTSQTKTDKDKSSGTSNTNKTSDKTATPSELADTGPGNVAAVVGLATVAGTVVYYVRLRKKLTA